MKNNKMAMTVIALLLLMTGAVACSSAAERGASAMTTPIPTSAAPLTPTALSSDTSIAPTSTPTSISSMTPDAVTSVKGPVWQVTVLSVARMQRLKCGSDSIVRAAEGYELLEVVAEFAPVVRSEKMSVSSEDAELIDRTGDIAQALGGGEPSEPATLGRESDSCGVGGSGRVVVTESYLIQDTLTTSFFFAVEEGQKGYKFQFMDYPPIDLSPFENMPAEDANLTSASAVTPVRSSGIGVPMTYKSLTITVTSATRAQKVGETSVVSRQYEAEPGFDILVVGMTIVQSSKVDQQRALTDWVNFALPLFCQSSVVDNDRNKSLVALASSIPGHYDAISCKQGATLPLGTLDPGTPKALYLAYAVKDSAKTFSLHFEEGLGLPELDLAGISAP